MRSLVRNRRSPLRAVAVAVVAAGVLVGCGSGPSQIGAAAIVGERTVPVNEIQQQLDSVLTKEGPEAKAQLVEGKQLDDVSREIVTQAVRHELMTVAARREGLAADEQEVARLIDQLGGARAASAGTVFDAEGFRERARDQLLAVELGRKYLPRLTVTVDYTTVSTRGAAMQKVQELSEAGSRGAKGIIRGDVEQGAAAALDQRIVAAENPALAAAPVFGVDEGTVVAFPSDEQAGSWLIMVVTGRSTDAGGTAPEGVEPAVLEAVGLRQLVPVAEDIGVEISPRYGVWDPTSVRVAPNANETTGFAAPVRQRPAA